MRDSGFASGLGETSSQNLLVNRRRFLLGLTSILSLSPLALGPLAKEASAQANFEPFSFAFISDVHLSTGQADTTVLLQESQLFLQDVVKQLNQHKLDFIVFGGDQVEGPGKDDSFWNLFIDVCQNLNAPWFFVLGEADVSGRRAVDKMDAYGPDFKGRNLTSGKPYWSTDPVPNVHLIGLDTSRPNTTTGDLSSEQLAWLKSDLEANKGKFTLAVSHHPLLAPPPYDAGPPWDDYTVLQGASAREIFAVSRDVRLCVSGHVPVNKVQQEGGIWYVSAATLSMYPCQFKIFTVSPQSIQVETYSVSYEALVKKARKILESSRLAFQYSSSKPQSFIRIADGEDLDRNALLPLVSGAVSQKTAKKKREKAPKESKEPKEAKHSKNSKDSKVSKDAKEAKDSEDLKDSKAAEEDKAKTSTPQLQTPAPKPLPAPSPPAAPKITPPAAPKIAPPTIAPAPTPAPNPATTTPTPIK